VKGRKRTDKEDTWNLHQKKILAMDVLVSQQVIDCTNGKGN